LAIPPSFSPGVTALESASFRFVPAIRCFDKREEEDGAADADAVAVESPLVWARGLPAVVDVVTAAAEASVSSTSTIIFISTVSEEAVASVTETAVGSCSEGSAGGTEEDEEEEEEEKEGTSLINGRS